MIDIPTWLEANDAVQNETATPIDWFVYNNEPAGVEETKTFRAELALMIGYVCGVWTNLIEGTHD